MLQMLVSEEVLDSRLKIFPSKTTETTLTAKLKKKENDLKVFWTSVELCWRYDSGYVVIWPVDSTLSLSLYHTNM